MKPATLLTNTLLTAIVLGLSLSAQAVTDAQFDALQAQFNQLADQVEANSKTSSSSTTIGGYGELHYNNLSSSINPADKTLDLHRFVLFVNHEFNDNIRLFSELEVEHANTEANGVVEMEQAYVQFDLNASTRLDAGMFLLPVGILNETHEPPAFYGVERNPVEKYIIPVTWSEGGVMLSGNNASGLSYNLALTSGLHAGTDIRDGRQSVSAAKANNLAATARAKYTGITGLTLSGTVQYQDDMTQDSSDAIGRATLVETHAVWNISDFTLTGLYAQWNIDVKNNAAQSDKDKDLQNGGYLEAAYKINTKLGVFVRQNQWDNGGSGDTSATQSDVGVNYWPHENVVIKADYQAQNIAAGDYDGFNLGIGYQF